MIIEDRIKFQKEKPANLYSLLLNDPIDKYIYTRKKMKQLYNEIKKQEEIISKKEIEKISNEIAEEVVKEINKLLK